MEYRIKRKFGLYYVQEKGRFFWKSVWTNGAAHQLFGTPASYYLREDAKDAIKRWKLEDLKGLEIY